MTFRPETSPQDTLPSSLERRTLQMGAETQEGIFTRKAFSSGEVVFQFAGKAVAGNLASPKALQIGPDLFWESTAPDMFDNALNHHCHPNCTIRFSGPLNAAPVIELVAIDSIHSGDQLFFDYNTTEYDLVDQECAFTCQCGSEYCRGMIQGFVHLPEEEQEGLRPWLSPFLLRVLDGENPFTKLR